MTAPITTTLRSIVTEGLFKAGSNYSTPDRINRAEVQWMKEIKSDIFTLEKKLKIMQMQSVMVTTNGQSRYTMPTDFSSDLTMVLMDGSLSFDVSSGTLGSVTFSSASFEANDIIGKHILGISGTGKANYSEVISYDSGTLTAMVSPNFATSFVASDTGIVVDTETPIAQKHRQERDQHYLEIVRDAPELYFPFGDEDFTEFSFYPVPYRDSTKPWGVRMSYYSNLLKTDLDGELMSTLYSRWEDLFIKGIEYKALKDIRDDEWRIIKQEYDGQLLALIAREGYGKDLTNMSMSIDDY